MLTKQMTTIIVCNCKILTKQMTTIFVLIQDIDQTNDNNYFLMQDIDQTNDNNYCFNARC